MADLPRDPNIDIKKSYVSSNPFREVNELYGREVDILIRSLIDDSVSDSIKHSIQKYLVVIIFAALDYFFRNAVRDLIDKNDLDVAPLFPLKSRPKLDKYIKEYVITKGNIVASTYQFVNIYEIDFVFSNLLGMDSFLDYTIKLNDLNQTRHVLDGHPLPIKYEELINAYKLRNDIAHEIKDVKISKSRVIALWDNFMNIMDLSQSVFLSVSDSVLRCSLDSDYQRSKKRAKRKATYKSCSDNIMSILLEKGQLTLTDDYRVIMKEINESNDNKIIMYNIDWVIPKMLKQRLIQIKGKVINLTSMGEKRFKRTTKINREKWRRELSNITSTWIAKT